MSRLVPTLLALVLALVFAPSPAEAKSKKRFGKLRVMSMTSGADIFIDGKRVGAVPRDRPFTLSTGKHTLRVELRGYTPAEQRVTIKPGKTLDVEADLLAFAGILLVETEGVTATVVVDGKPQGPTPFDGEVTIGMRTIEVRAPGRMTFRTEILFKGGKLYPMSVILEIDPNAPPPASVPAVVAPTPPAATARLIIDDAANCGLDSAVTARLPEANTVTGAPAAGDDLVMKLSRGSEQWRLEVHDAKGEAVLDRVLGADVDCEQAARSAALIVVRRLEDLRWPGLPAAIEAGSVAPVPPPPLPGPTPAEPVTEIAAEPAEPVHGVLSAGGGLGARNAGAGLVIDVRAELPGGWRAGLGTRIHLHESAAIEADDQSLGSLSSSVSTLAVTGGWCGSSLVRGCAILSLGASREAAEATGAGLFAETPQSKTTLLTGFTMEAEYDPLSRLVLRAGIGVEILADPPSWSIEGVPGTVRQAERVEVLATLMVGARVF